MASQVKQRVTLRIERLTARIGAIVHGVRLCGSLDEATVSELRQALHSHKVLFFREQFQLDDPEQEAFAGLFGETKAHPLVKAPEGTKAVFELDSSNGLRVNGWHTDLTYQDQIAYSAVLRAMQLPSVGGDTLWANTAAAYLTLPEPLRKLVDVAWVRHSTDEAGMPEQLSGEYARNPGFVREAEHPMVHVVPETGERALLMGFFFRKILGMNYTDSLRIYEMVQAYVTRPENVVRWRWAPGDVAMWDNRATQHYATADYSEQRTMHRVSIGEVTPVPLTPRTG